MTRILSLPSLRSNLLVPSRPSELDHSIKRKDRVDKDGPSRLTVPAGILDTSSSVATLDHVKFSNMWIYTRKEDRS